MTARSPRLAAVPTLGLIVLAGLGLALAGCDDRRASSRRWRNLSARAAA